MVLLPTIMLSVGVSTRSLQPASASSPTLASHVIFGSTVADLPKGRTGLPALEAQLGRRIAVVSSFVDWTYVFGGANERWMASGGDRRVLLSWEPSGIRFADVTSGRTDAYLTRVAESMKAFPYDVYVRPWPEMNACWSSWQPTNRGNKPDGGTPKQFVAAWRYTVTFMRARGVTHLKFVFDPDSSNWPCNTPVPSIWPGSRYVDVLGIDGYNWGNSAADSRDTGDRWRTFTDIFEPMYVTLTHLDATAPVWVTEVGCKEPLEEDNGSFPLASAPVDPHHTKAAWIAEMMSSTAFPRMTAIAWFDQRKERDWRLNSSPTSLAAIKQALTAN